MEDKYLKEIEVEAKEILDDTPLEDKLDYFFKLLVNVNIKKLNNKLDLKDTKKSLKENGVGHKSFIQFTTPTLIGKVGA